MGDHDLLPASEPSPSPPRPFRWDELDIFDPNAKLARLPFRPRPSTSSFVPPRHSLAFSLFASLLLPGLGSIINGRTRSGTWLLIPYLLILPLFLLTVRDLIGLIFLPFLFYLWLLGLFDAYAFAKPSRSSIPPRGRS